MSFIINVVNIEWEEISSKTTNKDKLNFTEELIHETKNNPYPKYSFAKDFYKFPSYLRRDAISQAIGVVSSYKSNLENYDKEKYLGISNGEKFKSNAPRLNLKHFKNPVFYKGNIFNKLSRNEMLIKVLYKNDWVWKSVYLREQDVRYIEKNCYLLKESAPTLIKPGRTYYLQFSYESDVKLSDTKVKDQTIISVDLGINTDVIVFEYLDFKGKRPKSMGMKFNMWAKRLIQEKTMDKAHSVWEAPSIATIFVV